MILTLQRGGGGCSQNTLIINVCFVLVCYWSFIMASNVSITERMRLLSRLNSKFALDLYRQLSKSQSSLNSNLFFSPLSISTALAMTYAGARENTASEMEKVLYFGGLGEDLHLAFSEVLSSLNKTEENCALHIANKMFVQKDFEILQEYKDITLNHYQAQATNVDFKADVEYCRKQINEWVESKTNQKIREIIPDGVLNELIRLVLVNAIYFKANWAKQFDKKFTRADDFYLDNSNKIKVNMMYVKKRFRSDVYRDLDSRVLEIPYAGEKMFMYIILPNKKDGLKQLESKLNDNHIESLSSLARAEDTDLFLPRFTLEQSYDLGESLQLLGISDLFSLYKADLSGIDGKKELFVSKVLHKAFVEVNEEGTEAAAATAVLIMKRSVAVPNLFKVDRPFVFLIKDSTGSVLFMGKVARPPNELPSKDEL